MDDVSSPAQMTAICLLTQLTQLSLGNSYCTESDAVVEAARLPSQISQLCRLQILDIQYEVIEASVPIDLPPELASLQSLASLTFSGVTEGGRTPVGRLSGLAGLEGLHSGHQTPFGFA